MLRLARAVEELLLPGRPAFYLWDCGAARLLDQGQKTLEPYRRCPGRQSPTRAGMPGAGGSSIRPFQVSFTMAPSGPQQRMKMGSGAAG